MPTYKGDWRRTGAFTLIELLVVIGVLGILMSFLLPALGGVSAGARKAETRQLLADVSVAITQFKTDERRNPGRFRTRDLAGAANFDVAGATGRGLTAMENALLDLVGGVTDVDPAQDNQVIESVGPFAQATTGNVNVDVGAMGGQGAYLQLSEKQFFPVAGQLGDIPGGASNPAMQAGGERPGLPDIVDSFGQPVLVFFRDSVGVLPPDSPGGDAAPELGQTPFVAANYDSTASVRVRANFYRATNAAYTAAESLGTKNINQRAESLLNVANGVAEQNLAAVLGAPAMPQESNLSLPAAPRGEHVLLSAGPDRVYFGRGQASEEAMGYGPKRLLPRTAQDADARGQTADLFDDVIQAGGG